MIDLRINYSFYAVGQGLFSAGSLSLVNHPSRRTAPPFRWVYDCGTTSSQLFVRNAIRKFKSEMGIDPLDLIVISHFDTDHISGMVQLLNEVGTKTLMLPWASLAHRLLIAFEQNISPDDPEFGFYVDPVGYLSNAAPDRFNEILFVGFGDGETPSDPGDVDGPSDFDPDQGLKLKYEVEESDAFRAEVASKGSDANAFTNVAMLKSGTAVSILGLWEFVPYNDPRTKPKALGPFQQSVDHLRGILLSAHAIDTESALFDLKRLYVHTFPKSQLNNLSLFLYGGTLGKWDPIFVTHGRSYWPHHWAHSQGSIIYTGDGNLGSLPRWNDLNTYLGSKRCFQPFVFQVPHHGSRNNWRDGLADTLEPQCSVFSSDPTHRGFGHPHGEVLRDFWGHHVEQVDKQQWFEIELGVRKQ